MKKAKIIGKKTLSVFLAVLMVLTAWVWVAPTEASAVSAGKYYVRVSYDCADKYDNGSAYTGPNFTDIGAGYTIYYAANNGTGTETYSSSTVINLTEECKSNFTTKTKVTEVPGFPTSVHYYNKGGTIWSRTYGITKVEVASTSSGTWTTLWEGDVEADAASTQWKAKIDKNGATKVNTGTGDWVTFSTTTKNWVYPKANSIVWNTAETSNITLSSTGTSSYTRNFKYVIKDKYGVIMGDTALSNLNTKVSYSLTSTNFPTLNNNGDIKANTDSGYDSNLYHTYTNGTSEYHVAVNVNDQLRSLVDGLNERTVTLKVTCGTLSSTKTFKINDSKHTITFNKNANDASNMAPATYSVYYGESLASQAVIDNASTYPTGGSRTGYTFLGMYDAAEGGNLMNVNADVTAAKTYYAHWEILKYAAVFLDRSGDNVVLVESDIPHGSAATKVADAASKLNKVEFDDVNHYVLNESNVWTPSTDSVTGNTFFYPNYVASAHTLDAGTAIEATCQHSAGIEYKCTGCNYSYIEETSTELGAHAKSESYIVDTEATCVATGSGHYFCTVCGATLDTVTIPAKGHSFKVEVTKDATCTKEGTRTYTCTVCDYSEEETIPLAQHNYVAGETVAATCQHSPYTPYTCSICGDSYNKYEGNATTNHNWDITVSDITADNTKIVTGTCSVCNATFTKEVELPATHNFTNIAITKQPTCKAEGEITISCADTGCTESYTATLPAVSTAHSEYTTTYTPATCGAKGSVVTKCKDCGVTIKETEIAALNHSYNYVRVEPTCTTAGSITKTCANCNNVQTEPISATGHKTVTVEANCQHGGYEKCGVCGETLSETPKKAHNYAGEVKEVPATCTVDGIRFTKCTDCDAQIADILGKTGHDTNAEWVEIIPATCTGKGLKTKTCSRCGIVLDSQEINALDHDYKKDELASYAPTCTTAGAEAEKCSRCGDINIDVIDPLGHDWDEGKTTAATCTSGGYITYTCQRNGCGETRIDLINGSTALTHDFTGKETIISNATCTSDGQKTVQCTRCDAVNEVIIPRLGHSYGAWDKTTNPATNDKDGTWTRECANCHDVETITIPKGGHNLVEISRTNAKCNEKGSVIYGCTAHTNCPITVTVELDYAQHKIAQREKEATCTKTGTVEAYCSECNIVLSTETIPVKAHSFVAQDAVAPTCTTAGYTPYKCSACSFTYNVFDGAQATGHISWTETGRKAATCTADGSVEYKCDKCDATKTEVLPKTGHNYVEDTSAATSATCKDPATKTYKCNNAGCGDTYTVIDGVQNETHVWGGWQTIENATNTSIGYKTNTCTVCGKVQVETIPATGAHIFDRATGNKQDATCTVDGWVEYACSTHDDCGLTSKETVPATGHTQKIVYTAPTCIAEGSSKVVCSVCSAEILSTSIPATGIHDFSGEGVITDPGCTTEGEITYTCETDGCTETKKDKIPAKGHVLSTTVNDAKCGEKGSVVTECANCNDPSVENTVELAAKGHIWGATPIKTEAATCETNGSETYKCENCDKTNVVVIPALGHDWNDWTVVPSTNGSVGSVSRTCKRETCKKVESVEIPAGGHNLVVGSKTDATCLNEGTITYICDNHKGDANCGITVTVTIPAKGHTNVVVTTPATCETDGSIVEKCGICENVIHKTTVIPKKGHAWDKGVVTKNATCTTPGVKTYTCANDAEHTYEETIPATGHKITAVTTPATCIQEGSVVEKCSQCTYELKVATIPKLQHDFSGEVTDKKDATCTEDGSKTIQCKTEGCTATTTVVIPHTGHTWNAWTITKPATNTDDGEMTRTCSNGKCTEIVVIPAGGHTWDNGTVTKDATCTETGTMVYKCNNADHGNCTASYEVAISIKEHTIAQKLTEATCKVEGSVKAYCSVCDVNCANPFSTQVIPVKAHVYESGTAVAPTCTTSGYTPYTCTCGASYNEYDAAKPATGHNLVEGISTATCVGAGEMTLSCNNSGCNYSRTVNVPALGHNYKKVSDTNATCAAASTETYKCSRCTASYTISVGEKSAEHTWDETKWQVQVSATPSSLGYKTNACTVCGQLKVETIPATGEHNFNKENGRQNATCTTDGWIKYDCSTHTNCGLTSTVTIPATGHTEAHEYKAATCTDDGYSRMVCSVESCKKVLAETVIPELGHLYGEGTVTNATCKDTGKIEYTCTRENCGAKHETVIATNSNAHQYVTVVTDSTCTVPGKVITKCNLCGNQIEVKTLPLIEHTWNDGEIKEGDNATCTADGKKTFTCTCGATKTEVIAKLGHDWGAWTETKASTNNDKGVLTRTCSRGCTETAEIPEGGHNLVVDSENSKVPSCTESGYTKYICNVTHTGDVKCGITVTVTLDQLQHEMVTETITEVGCETKGKTVTKCKTCDTQTTETTIPATGHAWGKGVEEKAASCTEEGTMTFTCANDATHQYSTKIAKLQHNYVEGAPVAATCTSSGYTPYQCNTCDSSYVILGEAAKGHNYKKVVSSTATCGKAGMITLECTECADTMTADVDAIGHNYVKISSTEATCAEAATETYKCNNCDAEYTVSVGTKTENHDWNDWSVAQEPTYTSIGYKTRTCKICEKLEVEVIKETGDHDLQEVNRVEPTCTDEGTIYYECKAHADCGVKSEVKIPALGHTEELRYTAATCTSKGSTSIYCTRCTKTIGEEKVLAKLDHVFEIESIVNATCKAEGSISLGCKHCDATDTVKIPVNTEAHKYIVDKELATCTKDGYVIVTCDNKCGYKEETTIPMLQHNWSEWSIKPSTYLKPGSMSRNCLNCSEIETVIIPAGGHDFNSTPDSMVAATCVTEGSATYKCTVHTDCGVEVTVKLPKAHHNLETEIVDASCTKGGSFIVSCKNCDYEEVIATGILAHDYEEINKVAATCVTAGYTTLKCKNCDAQYNRFDEQPLGHNFDDSIAANVTIVEAECEKEGSKTIKCSRDDCSETKIDIIPATGHKYESAESSAITAPTCTTQGYTTYTCDVCKVAYSTNFVKPNGHEWGDWTVEKEATNTTAGILSRSCNNNCGEKETAEIPAGGHSFDTTKPESTTPGTCQTIGSKTFKCTAHTGENACGIVITVPTELGAHNWSAWEIKDATNEADGYWKHVCLTDGCNESETLVIPRGHYLTEDTAQYIAPQCNAKGQRVYTCSAHNNCSVKIVVVLEMTQHTIDTINESATCQKEGLIKTYCTKCGKVFSEITLEKTPHDFDMENAVYTAPVQNPDGTWTPGYYTFTCKTEGCTATKVESDTSMFTVRFFDGNGKQIGASQMIPAGIGAVAPTGMTPEKAADGTYHYIFSGWDRDFSKIDKDLDVYATFDKEAHYGGEATCTTLAKCEKCNAYYGEYDESKHTVATKSKAASCETDGWIEYYCTNVGCKYNYNTGVALKKETIGASGHVYGQWTVIQNGTCEIPQIQQRKCVNYGCDKIEERRTQSTHTWLIEPRVEPTCTTVGYSEFRYCVTCNLQIDRVEIPKTDHRDLDGNGYCDYCGTSKGAPKCNCMCHSTGIMKFFYTIVRFFWIITRSSPSCSCGAVHY